jgi:hypothetical protein
MALVLLGLSMAQGYRTLRWAELESGNVQVGLVRISGQYLAFQEFQALVRGVVTNDRMALWVEGQVFDWQPKPGGFVEVWGLLERTEEGYRLRFHNGRTLGESRKPRTTPALVEGQTIQVWLKITEGGTANFPLRQGISEDGTLFGLSSYKGELGLRCVEGVVAKQGQGWALSEAKPCSR